MHLSDLRHLQSPGLHAMLLPLAHSHLHCRTVSNGMGAGVCMRQAAWGRHAGPAGRAYGNTAKRRQGGINRRAVLIHRGGNRPMAPLRGCGGNGHATGAGQ